MKLEPEQLIGVYNRACVLQGEHLETVTSALVGFCSTQTSMLDSLPSLGHIPKIFRAMSAKNDAIPKSAVQLAHALAVSKVRLQVVYFL